MSRYNGYTNRSFGLVYWPKSAKGRPGKEKNKEKEKKVSAFLVSSVFRACPSSVRFSLIILSKREIRPKKEGFA